MIKLSLFLALLVAAAAAEPSALVVESDQDSSASIPRLNYNNPGLVTDLGVGLWAWPLPMDYNQDGLIDLVVVCTGKPTNGIHVFLNTGEIDTVTKQPLFAASKIVGPSAPSPQISYVNGRPVITSAGQVHPDFLTKGFSQPVKLGDPTKIHPQEGRIRANQWKYVDYDGNGVQDLIVGIDFWGDYGWDDAWDKEGRWKNGPLHGYVYLLKNTGTDAEPVYGAPEKILTTEGKPVDVFGMPSPNFGDFDGDGDLDLVCGEFLDGFTYFENIGSRTAPRYAPGRRLMVAGQPLKMDLCMIAPMACDFDGDGDLDLVVGDEDGRVALIEHTGKVADGLPQFLPPVYLRQIAERVKFGALVTPHAVDWDGDGDEDLIAGDSAGYIAFIQNLGGDPVRWAAPVYLAAGGKLIREQAEPNGSIQGPAEVKWGYSILSVADWDGDGLPDIITNGIWGKIMWYKNVGMRTAPRLAPAQPIEVSWTGPTPKPAWTWWNPKGRELVTQWRTTPYAIDWNRDGLTDLIMLDQEGYLALFERRRLPGGGLELLPPQRVFVGEGTSSFDANGVPKNKETGLLRLNANPIGKSGRRTFCITDWDGDGVLDLVVNSKNVNFLRGTGRDAQGRWKFRDEGPVTPLIIGGHATKPTMIDLGGATGRVLLVGAEDGHLYLFNPPAKK
ncbi:MAG TPA: VCBS repeat-containing protein [Lacunisphaera sp.]